jgi:hypothetical protein
MYVGCHTPLLAEDETQSQNTLNSERIKRKMVKARLIVLAKASSNLPDAPTH